MMKRLYTPTRPAGAVHRKPRAQTIRRTKMEIQRMQELGVAEVREGRELSEW
jgi:hypothetical protein